MPKRVPARIVEAKEGDEEKEWINQMNELRTHRRQRWRKKEMGKKESRNKTS
jgi:hypothetical protein